MGAGGIATALGIEGGSGGTGTALAGYLGLEGSIGILSGVTLITVGILSDPSEETRKLAKIMPSGEMDMALELAGSIVGDENETLRMIGSSINFMIGAKELIKRPETIAEFISLIGTLSQGAYLGGHFFDNIQDSVVIPNELLFEGFAKDYDFMEWSLTSQDSLYNEKRQ